MRLVQFVIRARSARIVTLAAPAGCALVLLAGTTASANVKGDAGSDVYCFLQIGRGPNFRRISRGAYADFARCASARTESSTS